RPGICSVRSVATHWLCSRPFDALAPPPATRTRTHIAPSQPSHRPASGHPATSTGVEPSGPEHGIRAATALDLLINPMEADNAFLVPLLADYGPSRDVKEYITVLWRYLPEAHPLVLENHIATRLTVCKQETDSNHEYAVVTFIDREGRPGYLRLERDIGELAQPEATASTAIASARPQPSTSSSLTSIRQYLRRKLSKEAPASDLATWSRTLRKLPQDDELLYYNLTGTGNGPHLLHHFLAMGAVVAETFQLYRLLDQNCYLFTSIIMLLTERQFNVQPLEGQPGSADRKGHWHRFKILPHSVVRFHDISDVVDTYQKCVKAFDDLVRVMNNFRFVIQTRLTSLAHQISETRKREELRQQQQSEQQQELVESRQQSEELSRLRGEVKCLGEQLNVFRSAGGGASTS
ncbi:hypothetical protein DXG01_011765, partial [Tephrocybe rancida]